MFDPHRHLGESHHRADVGGWENEAMNVKLLLKVTCLKLASWDENARVPGSELRGMGLPEKRPH